MSIADDSSPKAGRPWYLRLWDQAPESNPDSSTIERGVDGICRRINFYAGQRILDIACGRGFEAAELAARGGAVTGLDASEAMLKVARHYTQARHTSAEWIHGDMRVIEWVGLYDAVMIRDVIFGIFDPATNHDVLRRAARALRPGGRLFLEVYNKTYALQHGVERWATYNADADCFEGDVGPDKIRARVYLFSPEEWRSILTDVGLTDICIYAAGVDDAHAQRPPSSARVIGVVAMKESVRSL